MTHHCVSLFLNIFSLQCCVFILSEWGLCYGLHTTIVYGFFNQHQIMESCLHLWAHPQKLEVCVCVLLWFNDSPQNVPIHIFPSRILVHKRWIGLRWVCVLFLRPREVFLCYTWCQPGFNMSTAPPLLLLVLSMATLLSHIFTSDYSQTP